MAGEGSGFWSSAVIRKVGSILLQSLAFVSGLLLEGAFL